MLMRNKKANWLDIPYFIIGAVSFGIVVVLCFIFNSQINASFHNTPIIGNDTVALASHDSIIASFPNLFDWVLPLIYVAFIGITVWSASLIQSSNKFLFIGFFLSLFMLFLSMIIENLWDGFVTNANISSYVGSFPITNFMLSELRYFTLFFCFIVMIMLYTRRE